MRIRNQNCTRQSHGGFATLIILTCIIIMVAILSRNASTISILKKTQTLQSRMGQPDWVPATIPGDKISETNIFSENLPNGDISDMEPGNGSDFDTDTGLNLEQVEPEETSSNDLEGVE